MKENIPMYLLTIALLGVAVYLRSPLTAIVTVGLWAVRAAETIMARKNRDADIAEIMDTLTSHKAQMNHLSKDITNVAERAKTILGDVY